MLVTLLTLLMVTLSVLLTTSVVDLRTNVFRGEERRVLTTALADAALAETLARLDEDPNFRGVTERALGIGRISSSVAFGGENVRKVTASGWGAEFEVQIDADVTVKFSRARIVRWNYRQGPRHR